MSKRHRTRLAALVSVVFVAILGSFLLINDGKSPASDQRNIAAVAITQTANATLPPPIGTIYPPTFTPGPVISPPSIPSLAPPPPTVSLPPNSTASPMVTPSPVTTITAAARPEQATVYPNVAWGAETLDSLTIWVGTYTDNPMPNITNARAIVKWNIPLKLSDMAFSPDNLSLTVSSIQPNDGEGDSPTWIWVIDMNTSTVQPIPDYIYYDLYENKFNTIIERILGWTDSNTLALQQVFTGHDHVVLANKNGSSYAELSFPT